jgi:hypothetical protein
MARIALLLIVAGLGGTAAARGAEPPSTDPYLASRAYAECLRARGVPHPNPDRHGDFRLTPEQERRIRAIPLRTRKAAENACFHELQGLNLKPLSPHAIAQAKRVVAQLGRCLRGYGYTPGPPVVRNLTRGRAFFGFSEVPIDPRHDPKRLARIEHLCEQRVQMANKIDAIIKQDRKNGPGV